MERLQLSWPLLVLVWELIKPLSGKLPIRQFYLVLILLHFFQQQICQLNLFYITININLLIVILQFNLSCVFFF